MISRTTLDVVLSLAMIAVAALVWGGIRLYRRGNDNKRAVLMLVAAAVLLVNVLILGVP